MKNGHENPPFDYITRKTDRWYVHVGCTLHTPYTNLFNSTTSMTYHMWLVGWMVQRHITPSGPRDTTYTTEGFKIVFVKLAQDGEVLLLPVVE